MIQINQSPQLKRFKLILKFQKKSEPKINELNEPKRMVGTRIHRTERSEASPATIKLFNRYITRNSEGSVDVSRILSKECYDEWLITRKKKPKTPPSAFRKAVTGHCRGDKGLKPFPKDVEAAVLKIIRKRKIWTCFEGTGINIGQRGCKTFGYWEKYKVKEPVISKGYLHVDINFKFPPILQTNKKRKLQSPTRAKEALLYITARKGAIPLNEYSFLCKYFNS